MQAIIKTGGKQYHVSENQFIRIESVAGEVGEKVHFDEILLVNDGKQAHIGSPTVDGAAVVGEIQFHARADKVKIIKFKRRKHYLKRQGHRQNFTQVKIVSIELGAKTASKPKAEKAEKAVKAEKMQAASSAPAAVEKKTTKSAASTTTKAAKTTKTSKTETKE